MKDIWSGGIRCGIDLEGVEWTDQVRDRLEGVWSGGIR